ncbi:MAG: hypothetical protein CMJ25_01365 [Phycisphaerae bacterium]|nr:hypothetical protein [Phycisphaerae bacterium]|tara:strand:+ start:820 stop:1632 length:813 start_codon:yes stop_codon:yes gene_type:complete
MLDKIVSAVTGGSGGDFLTNLIANRITSKVIGGNSNKEALMATLLMQGLGQDNPLKNIFGGEADAKAEQMSGIQQAIQQGVAAPQGLGQNGSGTTAIQKALEKGISTVDPVSQFKQAEGTLGYADFLVNAGLLDPNSKTTNLLNSKVGEALLTALGSGVADKVSGGGGGGSSYASRPFGGTGNTSINIPGARPNIRQAAQGGYIDGQYFPRRNGGIMPSEGSGQQDDVPAMLMAGEFVLTKDAVKGLGNGNSQKGIQKAYSMMNDLERRA